MPDRLRRLGRWTLGRAGKGLGLVIAVAITVVVTLVVRQYLGKCGALPRPPHPSAPNGARPQLGPDRVRLFARGTASNGGRTRSQRAGLGPVSGRFGGVR